MVNRLAEEINELAEKHPAIEDLVSKIFELSDREKSIGKPFYVKSELSSILKDFRLSEFKPTVVVVLGDATISELFLISQIASANATIISVRDSQLSAKELAFYEALMDRILYGKQEFVLVEGGSCNNNVVHKVGKIIKKFGRKYVDLLWFSSLGTFKDFVKCIKGYYPYLRKNSRIVLSGIRADKPKENIEGAKIWHNVKKLFKTQEYLARNPSEVREYIGSALGGGIGVVVWDPKDSALKALGIEPEGKSKKKQTKGQKNQKKGGKQPQAYSSRRKRK